MANQTNPASDFDSKPDTALVDVKTVADLLSIHRNSVWRMARSGRLPAPVVVAEQTTRWRVGDLRKALAALKHA
jgi:predicted DNA-binding transcriptional regulator AlpA